MGKVNWEEAKLLYVADTRMSYAVLAKHYGVAKPTVQAHGTKHKWTELRKQVSEQRVQAILEAAGDSYTEFEVRQVKYFKYVQASALQALNLINKEMSSGVKKYHASAIATLERIISDAMTQERLVLGIHYKPVRHPNDSEAPVPPLTEETAPSLDKTIERLKKALKYFKRRRIMIEKSDYKAI